MVCWGWLAMKLMERDYLILCELKRWGFCLGRHVRFLTNFNGTRACDRRLKILCEAGYIMKKKVLYGVPSLYTITGRGCLLLGASPKKSQIRLENIAHDITVLDMVIFIMDTYNLSLSDIKSEKQLHGEDGFSLRKHRPDFVFRYREKNICVEVELTAKAKDKLLKNLKNNYLEYESQIWLLSASDSKNRNIIENSGISDIKIINCEVVTNYIKTRQ
jgi:hypothetical protein